MRTVMRVAFFLLLASASALAAEPSSSTSSAKAKATLAFGFFGPFDAGAARPVVRQNEKGLARKPHPAVGDKGHIPGGGPPPPSLRLDPDLPELAGASPNAAPGLSGNPLFLASLVYSNFLTRMDGPRCQHLPTCSRFASQAVGRHGVLGIPMGLDRILQPPSSSAVRLLPELEYGGVFRHYDPVENYEFWHTERFTGFPLLVDEQPLLLTPPTLSSSSSSASPSSSSPPPSGGQAPALREGELVSSTP